MLRDAVLERVVKARISDGEIARYAAEVASHKRDPYTLVDEIVGGAVKV
jgi:hypothetical protein